MSHRIAALVLLLLLSACSGAAGGRPVPVGSPSAGTPVGMREVTFTDHTRTTDPTPGQPGDEIAGRTIAATIWYPRTSGRHPIVLFSHGLLGVAGDYEAIATRWAAAGLVVIAPTYPLTSRRAPKVSALDVVNQPADASFVLTSVLATAAAAGDPLHGLLDAGHVAAAGHSAGAITTVGLFSACCRDARLAAGIVLAGNSLGFGDRYAGRPAPMLFVHGDRDPIVPYWSGRLAWDAVPWPKAFVTLEGQGHIDPYLRPDDPAFAVVATTTTDFLRWSLTGDRAALDALRRDAAAQGLTHLDDRLT